MRDRDHLDQLIDAALATYGDPGADNDLEERMLRRVLRHRTNRTAPGYLRWLAWPAALATAACVLAFALFEMMPSMAPVKNTHQTATQVKARGTNAEVGKIPTVAPGPRIGLHAVKAVAIRTKPPATPQTAKAEPLPKLDVFPAPAPLDEQVEALAFFVRVAPPSEVKELLAKQAQTDAPLTCKELEIPPLQPLNEGGK